MANENKPDIGRPICFGTCPISCLIFFEDLQTYLQTYISSPICFLATPKHKKRMRPLLFSPLAKKLAKKVNNIASN